MVTFSGIVSFSKRSHPWNALTPIFVMEGGILAIVDTLGADTNVDQSFEYTTPSIAVNALLSTSTVNCFNPVQ